MRRDARIVVTGAHGLLGRAVVNRLNTDGFETVIPLYRTDCDLTDRQAVRAWFQQTAPTHVFHAAAYVAGIMGNMRNQSLSFVQNTLINTHVIEAAHLAGTKKIVAVGTVAMYPDPEPGTPQVEADVWRDVPHASERGYAFAKRHMLAQLDVFRESHGMAFACALSTNLYGPHDRFDIENGHVIPSLIRKFYEAKESGGRVTIWGDGSPMRDFLYVDDAARGLIVMMDSIEGAANLATGQTHPIRELVETLVDITGMAGRVDWDSTKPSGQLYRAYDVSCINQAGFIPRVSLCDGLRSTYEWYAANVASTRR